MPILTGVKAVAILIAWLAEKDFAAEFFGTARFDLLHDLAMARWHALTEFFQIRRAVQTEDVCQFDPSTLLKARFVFWETLTGPP